MPPRSPSPAYLQLATSVIFFASSQLLLKIGATAPSSGLLNFNALHSPWVWLGIIAEIISLIAWLGALRSIPLSVAYNLSGLTHAIIPLGCWSWLGENISPLRWSGIALVLAGVILSASSAADTENTQ